MRADNTLRASNVTLIFHKASYSKNDTTEFQNDINTKLQLLLEIQPVLVS